MKWERTGNIKFTNISSLGGKLPCCNFLHLLESVLWIFIGN